MQATTTDDPQTRAYIGRDPRTDAQQFIVAEGRSWATARRRGAWIAAAEAVEVRR